LCRDSCWICHDCDPGNNEWPLLKSFDKEGLIWEDFPHDHKQMTP